jgi:multicomponent Na+:H+ antiporter subunit E
MAKQQTTRIFRGRWAIHAAAMMGLWLLLSGHYDGFHIGLGVGAVMLVLWVDRQLPPLYPGDKKPGRYWHVGRLLCYLPWLFVQMIQSAWQVTQVVMAPQQRLDPVLIRFRSRQPNRLAGVILGNSITLTPGTLTVDLRDNEFLVHALTRQTASKLLEGTMSAKVAGIFADEPTGTLEVIEPQPKD